jgi:predicted NAD/FAD-binding protein
MKIAVIGSGISGLSSAFYLSKKHKVDLFEKDNHFGGHAYTYEFKNENKTISVDLGFIVFNELTYPNLINLFNELNISFEKSDMSFSVSVKNSNIEYGGRGLNAIFANKSNMFNLSFLKMIKEIITFYKNAPFLLKGSLQGVTVGSYLEKSKFSKYFVEYHIVPMIAAIWSMSFSKAKDMPLELFLKFFINHGLFKLKDRPQWYTVTNRSKTYVNKILANVSGKVFKNYKVDKIIRSNDNIRIKIENEFLDYDQVVLASHADQSLKLLDNPSLQENRILSKFKYIPNIGVLHTDEKLMPIKKIAWSSWNSITNGNQTCVTYWLNRLQNLKCDTNYFLTINPIYQIPEKEIIKKVNFTHPFFNADTMSNQKELISLQGKNRTWYCGAYFGYGFHEDGLKSAINMIKKF